MIFIIGILSIAASGWLFFKVCKLMFKIAWGLTKFLAMFLSILAIPALILGIVLASGVILAFPVILLSTAFFMLRD